MTWFDKIKFWKKEPELSLPEAVGAPPLGGPSDLDRPAPWGGPSADGPSPLGGLPSEGPPPLADAESIPLQGRGQPGFGPAERPVLGVTPKPEGGSVDKELQLVNAKLDTIKAVVESINQRLERMEKPQEKEVIQWR